MGKPTWNLLPILAGIDRLNDCARRLPGACPELARRSPGTRSGLGRNSAGTRPGLGRNSPGARPELALNSTGTGPGLARDKPGFRAAGVTTPATTPLQRSQLHRRPPGGQFGCRVVGTFSQVVGPFSSSAGLWGPWSGSPGAAPASRNREVPAHVSLSVPRASPSFRTIFACTTRPK